MNATCKMDLLHCFPFDAWEFKHLFGKYTINWRTSTALKMKVNFTRIKWTDAPVQRKFLLLSLTFWIFSSSYVFEWGQQATSKSETFEGMCPKLFFRNANIEKLLKIWNFCEFVIPAVLIKMSCCCHYRTIWLKSLNRAVFRCDRARVWVPA